jgi:hypothetical protein
MRRRTLVGSLLGAAMVAITGMSTPLSAADTECYTKAIRAVGNRSILESTAKSRARSQWIKRVRSHRRLGPAYAAWLRAKSPRYSCKVVGRRHICEAIAIPCRVPEDLDAAHHRR